MACSVGGAKHIHKDKITNNAHNGKIVEVHEHCCSVRVTTNAVPGVLGSGHGDAGMR